MLTSEMIEESSFFDIVRDRATEKGLREGRQQGRQQGRQSGRLEEARRLVRRAAALRFPQLGRLPKLDAVRDPKRLEALHDAIVAAGSLTEARAAVRRARLR